MLEKVTRGPLMATAMVYRFRSHEENILALLSGMPISPTSRAGTRCVYGLNGTSTYPEESYNKGQKAAARASKMH